MGNINLIAIPKIMELKSEKYLLPEKNKFIQIRRFL